MLEELPVAPTIKPRQPSAAELALQEENDQRIVTLLKYRLGPILTEQNRKFKRFTKRAAVSDSCVVWTKILMVPDSNRTNTTSTMNSMQTFPPPTSAGGCKPATGERYHWC